MFTMRNRHNYYKSLYFSEKILSSPPPLPQEFVETRWSYIHASLTWWNKYGHACVKLGHKVLEYLPKSDSHLSIWTEIVEMAANAEITVHRVLLLEMLDRLIMPGLHDCQKSDEELGFGSGFLAQAWPVRVMMDLNLAKLMATEPEFALPLTAAAMESLPPDLQQNVLVTQVKPFAEECVKTLEKHASRWHKFPLLFALGGRLLHTNLCQIFRSITGDRVFCFFMMVLF
eukprot:scpid42453/ scgid3730/ 